MKKNILVVNCGSTSTKYKFFNFKGEEIFFENFKIADPKSKKKEQDFIKKIKKISKKDGVKIAFRVVHGGELEGVQKIDNIILKKIKNFIVFAPIHNKIVFKKINSLRKDFEKSYQEGDFFAVFDTDFHRQIPKHLSTFPIDQKIAEKFSIKKYGFHGIAVESALSKIKDSKDKKIIFCHLGGGSSITAVKDQKSISNSMGLTPNSGLMMKSRVGDVDTDLDKILAQKMQKPLSAISDMLSRKSGFLAFSDSLILKDIFQKAQQEKEKKEKKFLNEELAFDIFVSQIVQKIGAYFFLLEGLDYIVFSGGVGERNSFVRKEIFEKIKFLDFKKENFFAVEIDEEKTILDKVIDL